MKPPPTALRPLRGRVRVPGDKAISHRAALLAALAPGSSRIRGFSPAGDCRASLELVRRLGCEVGGEGEEVRVRGLRGGEARGGDFDCGRSGTTMRLGAGLLAGLPLEARLEGDPQLLRRPMERVAEPLRLMGAGLETAAGGRPPLRLRGGGLQGIRYRCPVASAQVKSAILLAACQARGETRVEEEVPTRDHTERLLRAMGADLELEPGDGPAALRLRPGALRPLDLDVPGDASSAAVLAAAAALVPGSEIRLEGISANPGRSGFLELLARMGADLELLPRESPGPEPEADVVVRQAPLRAVEVGAELVPSMIDELPLLGLLATSAEGRTVVRGAAELRVKESDRISGLVAGLRQLGADVEELADGFSVLGPSRLRGGRCDSRSDHRLAMTFTLAGLVSEGPVQVSDGEFVADSFPGFRELLAGVAR